MTKELIRVKGRGNNNSPYGSSPSIKFAFVAKPEQGIRTQATSFFSCRDFINDTLRACVHKMEGHNKHYPNVDLMRLRLLIGKNCRNRKERYAFKEKLFSAKRLLNFYEEIAGWDSPSKITTVRLENSDTKNAWLLTGPVEWLKYSQLTSMVTLILRIISNYGPIEFTDINSVEDWFERLLKNYTEDGVSGVVYVDWDLREYLPRSYQKFYMLMKYHKNIFVDPMEIAHPKDGCVHEGGGIYKLCTFKTGVSALDCRVKETWTKYEKERQGRVRLRMEKQFDVDRGAPSL